jgi:lipopolysaccharide transport system permease protein
MAQEKIDDNNEWDLVIKPGSNFKGINVKELFHYKDLILIFVKRDFIANYKQTILGPLWHIIQPLLTTLAFVLIFGRIAGLSSDGTPRILFYLSGILLWSYFSLCLTKTSQTFLSNSHIFSKVYFPRLTMPVSIVISNMFAMGIQWLLFLFFLAYYVFFKGYAFNGNATILLFPVLVFIMALLGLGCGIAVASLTVKYKDVSFVIGFAVQLMMYCSSVIFPLSQVSGNMKWLLLANPMTPVIETFRYAFLGKGEFNILYLAYSAGFALFMLFIGVYLFRKVEFTFNDTV